MRFAHLLVTIALTAGVAQAGHAYCDPSIDRSIRGEYRRSVYVGGVRVRSARWLDDDRHPARLMPPLALGSIPGGLDPYSGAYYSVEQRERLKGRLPFRFRIWSENTTARTPLAVGRTYLVFLYRRQASDELGRRGDLMIDYCGNSTEAAHGAAALARTRLITRR